ncbi:MAG: SBBP repeat-containing protein, partial [Flavobacteriia bacterium]
MGRILLFLSLVVSVNLVYGQQPTQFWTNRFNGTGDFSQQFNSIVSAGSNSYVGGYSVKSGNQRDFYLSKFNSKGDTLWTRTYNGSASMDDAIVSMIADSLGNIYVSGFTEEKGTGKDICVLKYDAFGKLIWKYIYNNQNAGNDDVPVQISLDGEGNVLLVGSSDQMPGPKTNFNFITLKLDGSGNQLWLKSFDSSGEFDDVAIGLSVNTKNEVFVTGNTDNGSDLDIVTLKYTSTGSLAWMKAFNKGKNDRANSLCTDKGSVYVVGSTENGKDLDYTILKYSFAGAEIWQNGLTFNGAAKGNDEAIAVYTDNAGNLYVAGASDQDASVAQNLDFCVTKYNVNGTEQWTKTWGSSRDKDDRPSYIGATESGVLIIAGTSDINTDPLAKAGDFQAVGFNMSGIVQWQQSYSASDGFSQCSAAVIDNSGNILLCGKIREDQSKDKNVVLQFSEEGRFNWFKQQEPSGENTDKVNDLFLDESGNTYICGFTLTSEGQKDIFVQKTDPDGKTIWDFTHNGTDNGNDEALSLAVDLNGNVFVVGYSSEKGNSDDVLTFKISRDGQLQWLETFDYITVKGQDRGVALALDIEGNVYVTGTSDANLGSGISDDILVLKYNQKGILLWNKRYTGKAMGDDTPSGIAYLSGNRIAICGTTFNGTDDDILLIAFNDAGILQWEKIHNGNIGDDYCSEMTLDNGEKITLIGTSYNGKDNDIVTIQFTSDGTQNWFNQYDSGKGNDVGVALTSDVSRNIYITGTAQNGDQTDIVVRKMSDNGVSN